MQTSRSDSVEVGSIEGDIGFVQSWFTEEWQGRHESATKKNNTKTGRRDGMKYEVILGWIWLLNLFGMFGIFMDDFIQKEPKVGFHS